MIGNDKILTDAPITTAKQDRLNRLKFAQRFATTLMTYDDPSCLISALYGSWGSGKSSLLNLIEDKLVKAQIKRDFIIVRFNPWNTSNIDQLIATFFHELKVAVQGKNNKNILKDNTGELLNILSGILSIGKLSPIGSQYFEVSSEAITKVNKLINNKTLADIKTDIEKNLLRIAKRIFVFIDDIDRLDQDSLRLLFKMIRLNADFKNMTYILAFDPSIVGQLLDNEQQSHGMEYLEKIIQLPVEIPAIDESVIVEILTHELDKRIVIPNQSKFDQKLWRELVFTGKFFKYFRTVRDVVRYVNSLSLNYPIIANNVNMVDFMGIEAIKIYSRDSYNVIRNSKSVFEQLSIDSNPRAEIVDEAKNVLDKIFHFEQNGESLESGRRKELIKTTCQVLFPQTDRIYKNWTYGSSDRATWRKQKRICDPDIFDNYFLLGVPKGQISDEAIRLVISGSNDLTKLKKQLRAIFNKKLGTRFLLTLTDYLDVVPQENIKIIITSIFEAENVIAHEPHESFAISADFEAARIIYLLLCKLPNKDVRKKTLVEILNSTSHIYLPVRVVSIILNDGKEAADKLEWNPEDIQELKTIIVTKLKDFAKSGKLTESPHLGMLLYTWREWGIENEVKKYVEQISSYDEGVLNLLVGFTSEVISDTRHLEIDKKDIQVFIDPKILETRIKSIEASKKEVTPLQKEAIDAFKSSKKHSKIEQ